jgi:hypothetical protein
VGGVMVDREHHFSVHSRLERRAQIGAILTAHNAALDKVGVGIGVGNQVYIQADTEVCGLGSFVIVARHRQGARAFGTDSDTTAIYYIEDSGLIGLEALTVEIPAAVVGFDDFFELEAGGLTESAAVTMWTAQ